jgi:hypothetical protein
MPSRDTLRSNVLKVFRPQQYALSVKSQVVPLPRTERAYIDRLSNRKSQLDEGRSVRHRGHQDIPVVLEAVKPRSKRWSALGVRSKPFSPSRRSSLLESRHGLQWLARRCSSRETPVMRHARSMRITRALNFLVRAVQGRSPGDQSRGFANRFEPLATHALPTRGAPLRGNSRPGVADCRE